MKTVVSLIFLVLLQSCASMVPKPVTEPEIIQLYDIPNKTQGQIYDKTLLWVSEYYVSPKEVLQFQDKAQGKILIRASSKIKGDAFYYRMSIYMKNNKVKVIYGDFTDVLYSYKFRTQNQIDKIKPQMKASADNYYNYLISEEKKW